MSFIYQWLSTSTKTENYVLDNLCDGCWDSGMINVPKYCTVCQKTYYLCQECFTPYNVCCLLQCAPKTQNK